MARVAQVAPAAAVRRRALRHRRGEGMRTQGPAGGCYAPAAAVGEGRHRGHGGVEGEQQEGRGGAVQGCGFRAASRGLDDAGAQGYGSIGSGARVKTARPTWASVPNTSAAKARLGRPPSRGRRA
jgi:hypothetical protein